jgi:adenylylsulfate kinase
MIIQLTGLSGSGKTTVSHLTRTLLEEKGIKVAVIDGDVYRSELCRDLGFSRADRIENIRRLGLAGFEQLKHYNVVIIAAINPFEESRNALIELYGAKTVWLNCDLSILIARDHKGLYHRAMLPEDHPQRISDFTGISQEYETPRHADLIINTGESSAHEASALVAGFITSQPG